MDPFFVGMLALLFGGFIIAAIYLKSQLLGSLISLPLIVIFLINAFNNFVRGDHNLFNLFINIFMAPMFAVVDLGRFILKFLN